MFRKRAAVLAVTLILALPWCAAAAHPSFSPPALQEASTSLEQLRAGFWSWLLSVWTKGGRIIDPDGQSACGPTSTGSPERTAPNADVGCSIDPGGSPCGGGRQ